MGLDLGGIGSIVGTIFGGPIGGVIGGAAGSLIGGDGGGGGGFDDILGAAAKAAVGYGLGQIGGTESGVGQVSTWDPMQQVIARLLGGTIEEQFTGPTGMRTATPYKGTMTAPMPGVMGAAFRRLQDVGGQYGGINRAALLQDVQGIPAWQFNPQQATATWAGGFAIPAMETWKQTVAPLIREEFAGIPGGFYSAARGRTMQDAASRYYGEYVQPTYWQAMQDELGRAFTSGEAAAGRRGAAVGQLTALPAAEFDIFASASERMQRAAQPALTAQYQEFLRTTPEASPWLRQAGAFLGMPSTETIVTQGTQGPFAEVGQAVASEAIWKVLGGRGEYNRNQAA